MVSHRQFNGFCGKYSPLDASSDSGQQEQEARYHLGNRDKTYIFQIFLSPDPIEICYSHLPPTPSAKRLLLAIDWNLLWKYLPYWIGFIFTPGRRELPRTTFWRSDILHLRCHHCQVIWPNLKCQRGPPGLVFFCPPFGYALPRYLAVTCCVGTFDFFCKVSHVKHSTVHTEWVNGVKIRTLKYK